MDSPDRMDSPACDRNPSPPPEFADNKDLLSAECIGNTAFSKHWLFTTLIKMIEEVNDETTADSDLVVDIDEELQNELCKLWDMSMNTEVAVFLDEFKAVDIMSGIIQKSKAPRVIEICVGILGNIACEQTVCKKMSDNHKFIDDILAMMETRDVPTLVETTRLIFTSLTNTGSRGPWIKAAQRSEELLDHLKFIFSSATNCDLLKNTAEIVDTLLNLEPDLCVSWATIDFVHSLLEATEQIGSNHSEAMEVYLHIFHSFSTTEPGVEALVSHIDRLEAKILKYLNIVCEYEIVGVDGKEQALSSALSVLNILLTTRPPHKLTHLCNDERMIRILLKILEPLYPMLENYKESKRLHSKRLTSAKDTNTSQSESNVASCDRAEPNSSQSEDNTESGDKEEPKDSKGAESGEESAKEAELEAMEEFTAEDEQELRQLTVLYDILSAYILDYCNIVFIESSKLKLPQQTEAGEPGSSATPPVSNVNTDTEPKRNDSNLNSGNGDNSNTKGGNSDNGNNSEMGDDLGQGEYSNNSNSETGSNSNNSNGEENSKGDNCVSSKDDVVSNGVDSVISCLPVLTYLDESCSRWRINNFGLTLQRTARGPELFLKIWELAEQHKKHRLIRILTDIEAGRIVTRAQSTTSDEN